jgi:hypothetical protein
MTVMGDHVEKLIASVAQPLERTHGPFQAVHPIIRKFPAVGGTDYNTLRDDIQKNGQRKAIGIYQGYIWDGRARYDACRDLQIIPKIWMLRVRDPIIYLLQRHRDRYGLPRTPERETALEVLREVEQREWQAEVKRRHNEWLKFARDEFQQTVKVSRCCAACGLDHEYSHAHHSVPLSVQYEMGLDRAIQDHDWLCSVHHKMVHKLWSSALTPTHRNYEAGLMLKYELEPKRTQSLAAGAVFERGFKLFTDMGGVSQGRHWEMVRP